MSAPRRTAAALVLASLLAAHGCAGTGASSALGARHAAAARTTVGFTMHWPDRAQLARRRPSFISPSTGAVVIEVNPDSATPGPVTFADAPPGGGTSTIAVDAPVGADVFVISLYDAPQTPGETTAVGNELGRVRLAQTIAANATNTLSATVVGTVASIRIGPLPNQTNVIPVAGASPAAYELVGRSPATFTVAPLDADGNAILQPDAPPAIALAPNVRATGILAVAPVAAKPDQFTVQAVAPNTSAYPTSLVATARDANGGRATSSLLVDETSAIYVAYADGGAPAVARFEPNGTAVPLPSGAFAGLANPVALAYDPDDRAIFVADAALGKVLAFDEDGAPLTAFAAPAVAGANGVTYDPHNGNVYASGSAGITVFAPGGGAPRGGAPASFAAPNAQGIAYLATSSSARVDRIAAGSGTATPQILFFSETGAPQGAAVLSAAPRALAYGAPVGTGQSPSTTSQLYVTSAGGIAAFTVFGQSVATATDAGGPFGIAVDPNRNLVLVTERASNALASYLDDLSALDATRSFPTPAAFGLREPQGVVHVF